MSFTVRALLALGLVAFVSACAPKPEPVYVAPEPIAAEPVYNKV